jgi:putative SOS response-associated peptidase YedK
MHHRVPAILATKEDVLKWLDSDLTGVDAVDVLQPVQEKQVRNNYSFEICL